MYSPNPTFVPSLSEIGDLSCITSCLILPGFLMDTLLKMVFQPSPIQFRSCDGIVLKHIFSQRYQIQISVLNSKKFIGK